MAKTDKNHKKNFPYDLPVELDAREEDRVEAWCPLLPGCKAQGHDSQEALDNLKNAVDLFFSTASPAHFQTIEQFHDIPILYDLCEFKGHLYIASGRDQVLRSSNVVPGSFETFRVTNSNTKFFTPTPNHPDGAGDYTTQIYCLCQFAPPGKEQALFAGTNLNGSVYFSWDGRQWEEAFSTGEDRLHSLHSFRDRLYAGTSSHGKIFAYDGVQWNLVGNLGETAITCFGEFQGRLFAGTYPNGCVYSSPDGLNWSEVARTGQTFVQCFKEFNGALYVGISSSKGVKIFRTQSGLDWETVYDSERELNIYCLEVYENALYAGTGNSGRVLKTLDGRDWKTAYAGDEEGIRAFLHYQEYFFACTENKGALLRSTFSKERIPNLRDLEIKKVTSSSALVTWTTDLPATSELHYGMKGAEAGLSLVVTELNPSYQHLLYLTGLKDETEYEFKAAGRYKSSAPAASEISSFKTLPVAPPDVFSPTHPHPGKWTNERNIEIILYTTVPLTGFYYKLNDSRDFMLSPQTGVYSEERRLVLPLASEGTCYFHVVGVDQAGNIGTHPNHFAIGIDTEVLPPRNLASSTHPDPAKWVSNSSPLVAWEVPPDLSGVKGFYVKADHEPLTLPGPGECLFTTENRATLGPLEDGLWYVHIATQDEAGNIGMTAAHLPVRIDTQSPVPVPSSTTHPHQDRWYSNGRIEVILSTPPDLSGLAGYYYCADQEPETLPEPSSSRWTEGNKVLLSDLQDGVWYFHVRAKDRAGNISFRAGHHKFCLDTQALPPPRVTSSTHSDSSRWYCSRGVEVQWEEPFEHSSVEGYYYHIDREKDTVPNERTSLFTVLRSLFFEVADDGPWYFHVATKDKAGNLSRQAAHFSILVDTSAGKPFLSSPTHPDQTRWYTETRAVFRVNPPEDLSGIKGYSYQVGAAATLPDPKTSLFTEKSEFSVEIPEDGIHWLSVVCLDKAGNVGREPAIYELRLDTVAPKPEITSLSHSFGDKWYCSRNVALEWRTAPDLSGIEGYYYCVDREPETLLDPSNAPWMTENRITLSELEDGVWFFHLRAKDRAGNLSKQAGHFKFCLDTHANAPLNVSSPTHGEKGKWYNNRRVEIRWEDPPDSSGIDGFYYQFDRQPETVPNDKTAPLTDNKKAVFEASEDGRWFFHVTTRDKAGNLSREAAHFTFLIDTQVGKPALSSQTHPDQETWYSRTHAVIQLTPPEDFSGIKGYYYVFGEAVVLPDLKTSAFTEKNEIVLDVPDDGIHWLSVVCLDEAGNIGDKPETYQIRLDTTGPPPELFSLTHPSQDQWYGSGKVKMDWKDPRDLSGIEGYYTAFNRQGNWPVLLEEMAFTTERNTEILLEDDGIWYFHACSKDKAGNISTCARFKIQLDLSAAPSLIESPTHPRGKWRSASKPLFTWEAPPELSGVEGYFTAINQQLDMVPGPDNGEWTVKNSWEGPLLEDGRWYFHVTTKDKTGNLSREAAHYPILVDTRVDSPSLSSSTHPNQDQWYNRRQVLVQMNPPEDPSGIKGYFYNFGNAKVLPDSNTSIFTEEKEVKLDIPQDGVHVLSVVCQDGAGNIGKDPAVFQVRLDTFAAPPEISSPSHPNQDQWYGTSEVDLVLKDAPDLSGIEGYYSTLNRSEKWDANLSLMDYSLERKIRFTLAEDGVWYAHLCAKDKAGNVGPCARFKIQVDFKALPPIVHSSTHPTSQWRKESNAKFTWDTPPEVTGVEGYYITVDQCPDTVPGPDHGEWITANSWVSPPLVDGRWYFHAVTKDRVGNLSSEAAHYPILIDTTPPKSSLEPLPALLNRTQIRLEWDAEDTAGVKNFDLQVKVGREGTWSDWLLQVPERCAFFAGKDGERYAFRCRARDEAGNQESYSVDEMTATTLDISPPPPVHELTAEPRPGGEIGLKWVPVEDRTSGTDFYRVYRWMEGGTRQKISTDGEIRDGEFLDRDPSLEGKTVYYYCVQAVDKLGNEQMEGNKIAASLSVQGVGTPTVTSETHPLGEWSSQTTALLRWEAPGDLAGIAGYYFAVNQEPQGKLDLEGAVFQEQTKVELKNMTSGTWYFHLAAKDKAGNISDTAHFGLKLDAQKPTLPVLKSPTHPDPYCWYSTGKIRALLSSSSEFSGVESFYYDFDRKPDTRPAIQTSRNTTGNEVELAAPEAGVWWLHAVARNRAGTLSEPTHLRLQIAGSEMPPPVIASSTHPLGDEPADNFDPVFTWEDRHDGNFKPAGYVYKLSRDEADKLTQADSFTQDRGVQLTNVEEGVWYFHLAAVGENGEPGFLASCRKIAVRRLGKVQGTFLGKDGVTPVAGAKVGLAKGDQVEAETLTDSQGRFFFPTLGEGRYELRLYSEQFPPLKLKDLTINTDTCPLESVFTEDLGIYPNPTPPGPVRFYYFLKEDCDVTLEVYDSSGTLVDKTTEKKEGGSYAMTIWDAAGKTEGEYLYKLTAKNLTKSAMSRFAVKKFKIQRGSRELAPQPVS